MNTGRLLITGAEGFVGLHLLNHLIEAGWSDIHATTRQESAPLTEKLGSESVHQVELTGVDQVVALFAQIQPRYVIHLASISAVSTSFDAPLQVIETNTRVQFAVLEAIRQKAPTARFLGVGSAEEYGAIPAGFDPWRVTEEYPLNPENPYAVSKVTQEMLTKFYARSYQLDTVWVRPFNQVGPGQNANFVLPAFASQIVSVEQGKQRALKVGNLEAVRDFTDVRDAVTAYPLLLEQAESRSVYNLGSGNGKKIGDLLQTLIRLSNQEIPVETDPTRLRPSDVPVMVADNSRLRGLGWTQHYEIEQTLQDVLEFERHRNGETV